MKYSVPTLLILPLAYGWTPQQNRAPSFVGITASKLMVKKVPSEMDMTGEMDLTGEVEMDNGNPCWEDLYDDDCAMSNVAAASFVASEWIKSLPCAEGIEDCDMLAELTVPVTRHEAGVADVDVMDFLGLKHPTKDNLMP